MSDLRPVGWIVGLLAVAIVTTAAAVVLTWVSSDLQVQVHAFYNSRQDLEFTDEVFQAWDRVAVNAYTMLSLATPLLIGGLAAVLALLAVLAFRWERRRAAPDQATAAS